MLEVLHPFILQTHILTAFSLIAVIFFTDIYGFTWLIGKQDRLSLLWLKRSDSIIWAGLFIMVVTGILLFYPYQSFLLANPAFQVKILFVVAIIINGLFIGRHMSIATTIRFNELTTSVRSKLIISGAVSTIAWVGSVIAAYLIN